jgi:hypothetical protein
LLKVDRLAEGIEIASLESAIHIVNRVIGLNQKSSTLEQYREKADQSNGLYTLRDNLLLYRGRLVVPVEADETLPA